MAGRNAAIATVKRPSDGSDYSMVMGGLGLKDYQKVPLETAEAAAAASAAAQSAAKAAAANAARQAMRAGDTRPNATIIAVLVPALPGLLAFVSGVSGLIGLYLPIVSIYGWAAGLFSPPFTLLAVLSTIRGMRAWPTTAEKQLMLSLCAMAVAGSLWSWGGIIAFAVFYRGY